MSKKLCIPVIARVSGFFKSRSEIYEIQGKNRLYRKYGARKKVIHIFLSKLSTYFAAFSGRFPTIIYIKRASAYVKKILKTSADLSISLTLHTTDSMLSYNCKRETDPAKPPAIVPKLSQHTTDSMYVRKEGKNHEKDYQNIHERNA